MGDSVSEGTVSSILKGVGDPVDEDEVIGQIETDKVTLEVRAPRKGIISELLASDGDTVAPGNPVVALADEEAEAQEAPSSPAQQGTSPGASGNMDNAVAVEAPSMGDSVSEGSVGSLLKQPGDEVYEDEVLMQIETDKVTIDVRASLSGVVETFGVNEGDTVTPGQKVATLRPGAAKPAQQTQHEQVQQQPQQPEQHKRADRKPESQPPKQDAPPQPSSGADESDRGSGGSSLASTAEFSSPDVTGPPRGERRERMSRLRQRVAERLKDAQNTYAMLSTFNECDMTNISQFRSEFKDEFQQKHGVKLGFMSAFVKASAKALEDHPAVNGVIDGTEVIYREHKDISIAVGTDKGLVVPVLRNAESMSFADVEGKISEFGKKAKDGTLSIDEMSGGTFTISNGGVYGSLLSTPIINPPQSAILGMHSIVKRPWVVNEEVKVRPIMNLALTYDHRLIDGREAVLFLNRVKQLVEEPRRLILDL
jgi:2-oxoglutarate dehydrogenase E2 component (dihydrolipoamide succinyltransferase)